MDYYLGDIQIYAFDFAPRGTAACNGTLLPISQYSALFALLGTQFGGDGRSTFGLPDLQGRTPVGGNSPSRKTGETIAIGAKLGVQSTSLTMAQMPAHNHLIAAGSNFNLPISTAAASTTLQNPVGAYPATATFNEYTNAATGGQSYGATLLTCAMVGSSTPFPTQSPYIGLNFCIATVGIFPPRN